MDVEIKSHPTTTADHPAWLAIVTTTRGYCYFLTWAGEKPTEDTIRQTWKEDRKAFDPYVS